MTRFDLLAPVRVVQLCNGRLHNWQRRADIPRSDDLDDARSASRSRLLHNRTVQEMNRSDDDTSQVAHE